MRLVLDTNVIVAALRSPEGASAALIERALDRVFVALLSVALALEYEAVAVDPAQRIVSGLAEDEVRTVVTAICAVSEPVQTHFLWRPQLRDPSDEMVLEAAINGHADAIVTFNRRDFGGTPARFGIKVWAPREALRWVER
jgi:putative PIN family toxin of toxin-antitoxin system